MEIFCGAVKEPETRLCAWSYLIKFNKKEYSLVSHRVLQTDTNSGELIALVKSFGYAKNLQTKRVGIYLGDQSLIDTCTGLANPKTYKKTLKEVNKDDKGLYCCLEPYFSRYIVSFHKVTDEENPAYKLALEEFQKIVKQRPEDNAGESCDNGSDGSDE